MLYVIETETFVTKTLRPLTADTVEDVWQYDTIAPTHFLGELSKTPEGCQMLRERGLVSDYAEIIRIHGIEDGDEAFLMNVKMALWALASRSLYLRAIADFTGQHRLESGRHVLLGRRRNTGLHRRDRRTSSKLGHEGVREPSAGDRC